MNTFIYILVDPRTQQVKYVGKSNNPSKRLLAHLKQTKTKANNKKVNWLRSLLILNLEPELEVIDEIHYSVWKFWEKYWISQFKAWGFNLTNQTEGGESMDQITAWKMGLSQRGKKQSTELVTKRMSSIKKYWETDKGKKKRVETNESISAALLKTDKFKIKLTPAYRKKLSDLRTEEAKTRPKAGCILWKENKQSHPQFKPFVQYDLKGELVKVFDNYWYTIEYFNGKKPAADASAKHIGRTMKGFIYRYLNPILEKGDLPNTKESILETIRIYTENKIKSSNRLKEVQKLRWSKL